MDGVVSRPHLHHSSRIWRCVQVIIDDTLDRTNSCLYSKTILIAVDWLQFFLICMELESTPLVTYYGRIILFTLTYCISPISSVLHMYFCLTTLS